MKPLIAVEVSSSSEAAKVVVSMIESGRKANYYMLQEPRIIIHLPGATQEDIQFLKEAGFAARGATQDDLVEMIAHLW